LLSKWIASSRPTVLHLTPQLLQIFFAGLKATDSLDSIKYLLVGGDVLSISLRKRIRQALPSVSLVNVYGATETPQVAGYYVDDPIQDWKSLPVGQGISDTQLLIVDSNGSQLAVGQVGEIAVRSNYLAIGYLGDSANMAELEEWNKKISSTTDNTYLTGDRGYYLPDGNVICLGRTDDQVKIRGFRVELSEIDVELCRIEHIDQAITVYVEKQDSNPALVSYIVSKKDNENDSQRVKNSLESRLPSHMIPAYFVFLNQIPLLPNGKVDRQALPAPGINDRSLHAEYIPPTTDSEISLVNDWEKILGVSPISVESTYSDLGGDSLSYVSTYVALEDKIGKVPDDWTVKTVKELAGLRNKSNWLSWIDTSMLVRAFSIFFIVAGHSKLFSLGGGFTSSLFMVSGFLLASLQIRQINYFQSSRPLYDLLLKVLLPTLIYSVIAHLTFKETHLSTLLLYSNFVPFDTPGRVVWLWYVHCMIQIIAIMWLLVSIDRIRKVLLKNTYTMLLVMYVVSVFLSLLSVYMTEPLYLTQGVPKQDILNWLPQTHLPTFLLGMLAYASSDRSKKLYSLMVALPYLLMAYYAFPRDFNMILIALIMLMFIKEVPMVKPLNYIVLTLSGASLFIYLTHFQWVSIVEKLGFYEKPILFTVVGLLGGVLVWRLWLKFQTVARHVIKIHLKR